MSQTDYSAIIIETINSIFTTLFSSIDNSLYSLLDKLAFIDSSIITDSFFSKAFGSATNIGLLSLANSLLIGIVIYYCYKLLLSPYTAYNIERPYHFLFKVIIFAICINSSQFLCNQIISINCLVSDGIKEIGTHLFNTDISFNSLITQTNAIASENSFSLFSFDGMIKSFISMGLINLLFSYSLRYIMVKVFILLSPFAILSLISSSTSWFFKSWFRNFISLLLLQSFVTLILLVVFSMGLSLSSSLSKLLYLGSIYALTKSNYYIREMIGGISTEVNTNVNMLKTLIKQ